MVLLLLFVVSGNFGKLIRDPGRRVRRAELGLCGRDLQMRDAAFLAGSRPTESVALVVNGTVRPRLAVAGVGLAGDVDTTVGEFPDHVVGGDDTVRENGRVDALPEVLTRPGLRVDVFDGQGGFRGSLTEVRRDGRGGLWYRNAVAILRAHSVDVTPDHPVPQIIDTSVSGHCVMVHDQGMGVEVTARRIDVGDDHHGAVRGRTFQSLVGESHGLVHVFRVVRGEFVQGERMDHGMCLVLPPGPRHEIVDVLHDPDGSAEVTHVRCRPVLTSVGKDVVHPSGSAAPTDARGHCNTHVTRSRR
ncbi:MAG: hypothetical protein WAX28_12020 [Corynebacterium variabile]